MAISKFKNVADRIEYEENEDELDAMANILEIENNSIMAKNKITVEMSTFKIRKLIELAADKAKSTQNYIESLDFENDEEFLTEQMATLVFYQNLRDELQSILNQQ